CVLGERHRLDHEKEIEPEHDDDADEAPLLAEHCEDEVGVARGEKRELRLRSLLETLPVNAAGTDRDLCLRHLIARLERIALGVEEDHHALALIAPQHLEIAD